MVAARTHGALGEELAGGTGARVVVYGIAGVAVDDLPGVRAVGSPGELQAALAAEELELVVFGWEDGLPDRVRRARASTRLVCFEPELSGGLLRALEEGWDIGHVDDAESLRALLAAETGVRARRPERRRLADVTFEHRGGPGPFAVVDLANGGLAFRLPAGADLDGYLPGTRLEGAHLRAGPAVALGGVDVVVRHVTLEPAGYRVGCAFDAPAAPAPGLAIRDRARCAALLSAALRSGGVFVSAAARGALRVHLDDATASVSADGLTARGVFHTLRRLGEVHGAFEIGGRAYRFATVVLEEDPLVLRLPDALEPQGALAAPGFRPAPSDPVRVELRSPLLGAHLRAASELSAAQVVVDLDEGDVLPVGALLPSLTLRCAGTPIAAHGRVESHEPTARGVRCAIALSDLEPEAKVALARFLVEARFPASAAASPAFDEIIAFFRDAGFMPADKERVLAPIMPEVRRTFEVLAARPSPDFQSVVIRDPGPEGRIAGYLSGARAYSRTFFYQHLAGRHGRAVGGPLILSLTEHLLQLGEEYEFFKFFFLKGNPFPTRVLESFGRKVGDPWQCDMRAYTHLMVSTAEALGAPPRAIEVHDAASSHLDAIERYFVATHRGLLLRADDLTRQRLALGEVDARYRELGLFRTRRALVARRGGKALGFALAEVSSAGLNLSEGLSSARVHVLDAGRGAEDDVRAALLQGLQRLYAAAGRTMVFALVSPEDAESFARIGAKAVATSLCVTAHASLLPTFFAHVRATSAPRRRTAPPS